MLFLENIHTLCIEISCYQCCQLCLKFLNNEILLRFLITNNTDHYHPIILRSFWILRFLSNTYFSTIIMKVRLHVCRLWYMFVFMNDNQHNIMEFNFDRDECTFTLTWRDFNQSKRKLKKEFNLDRISLWRVSSFINLHFFIYLDGKLPSQNIHKIIMFICASVYIWHIILYLRKSFML